MVSHGRPHSFKGILSGGKMLRHAWSGSESKRAQNVEPIGKGNRGKRRLDPPGGEKAGRRRSGYHTLAVLA